MLRRGPVVLAFEDSLDGAVEEMTRRGYEREALVSMTNKLQSHLACDLIPHRLPQSGALELILRAVSAVLEGMPVSETYIWSKLANGIGALRYEATRSKENAAPTIEIE